MDRQDTEQITEKILSGQLSRRDLVKRAALLGMSAPAIASLLAACDDDTDDDDAVADVPDDDDDEPAVEPDDDDPDVEPDDDDVPDDDEPAEDPDDDRYGGSITIVYSPTVIELDVQARNVGTLNETSHYYYEPLFDRDENQEIYGLLVEEFELSDDGLVHTFHLQSGVTFHDGSEFNAEVVEWNLNRKVENELVLYDMFPLDSMEVIDELTIEITLTRPSAGLYGTLASRVWSMYSPSWVEEHGEDALSEDVNGTGPFTMAEYVPNEVMRLERNPDYWQDGLPYLDEVVFRVVPDVNTRATMLETGEADIALGLNVEDIQRFADTPEGPEVLEGSGSLQYYIPLNMTRTPTDEQLVRQAMNYAVDHEGIMEAVLGEYGTVANCVYVPPVIEGHTEAGVYEFDPDQARELLDEAGWVENGNGGRERDGELLSVNFKTRQGHVAGDFQIAELVQAMLQDVGINCEIELMESAAFLDASTVPPEESDYNMLNLTVRTVTLDVEYTMLTFYHCDSQAPRYFNRAYLCDEEVDELIEQALEEPTVEERNAVFADVARRVHELAPIIQEFDSIETVAVNPALQGVFYDPAHVNWPAKYAWLEV